MTSSVNTDTQDTNESSINEDSETVQGTNSIQEHTGNTPQNPTAPPPSLQGKRELPRSLCDHRYQQELVLDAPFACQLEGLGTFLLFEEGAHHILFRIHEGSTYQKWTLEDLGARAGSAVKTIIPINPSNLVVLYEADNFVLLVNAISDWDNIQILSHSKGSEWDDIRAKSGLKEHEYIFPPHNNLEATLPSLGPPSTGSRFANLRHYGMFDFKIGCGDGKIIEAHRLVLGSQWVALHNLMLQIPSLLYKELPFSSKCVEPLISYFYDEQKPLDFMAAVAVVSVAEVYRAPSLLTYALRRIRQEDIEVHQALEAWKLVRDLDPDMGSINSIEVVSEYCAARIQDKLGDMKRSEKAQEILSNMDQEELIRLYNDLSKSIGAEEKRREERLEEM